MPEPRDKQQLAKIALRRRPVAGAASAPPPAAPAPSAPAALPGGQDLDDAFDRSFAETFGGPADAAPVAVAPPDLVGAVLPPQGRHPSTEILVDIAEPVAALEPAGEPSSGFTSPSAGGAAEDPRSGFLRTLAADTGVPAIDLDRVTFDLGTLDLLPRDVALRNLLLPVVVVEDRLVVAVADPSQRRAIEELEFVSGCRVVPHVAPHSQVRRFVEACYRARAAGERTFGSPGAAPPGRLEAALVVPGAPSAPHAEPAGLASAAPLLQPIDLESDGLPLPIPIPAEPAAAGARKRVLVVDDELDIRQLVVRVLRDRGYEVIEAAQGSDALRAVQAQPPDLLVLDAMLPEIHGFDVCRRIKQSPRYRHIPVIMISAIYRGWRFATDLRKSYGVDHFLEKPFKIGELVAKVEQILSGSPEPPAAARELSSTAQSELAEGVRKYREGDHEGAVAHLRRGIEADPLSSQLHYHLGILYGKMGRIYEAIQELEAALEVEPGDFATLRGLGQLYEHAGFPLKAVEMWERAANASTDEAARSSIKEHLLRLL